MNFSARAYGRTSVALRTGFILGASAAGFYAFHHAFQGMEAKLTAGLVSGLGAGDRVAELPGHSLAVHPYHGPGFRAVITPSCSALASVLTMACLSLLSTGIHPLRRVTATTAAMVAITAGNIIRIASSVTLGLFTGRSALVLFHDWVGGLFTFVYTLGGYILLLWLLLPKHPENNPKDSSDLIRPPDQEARVLAGIR